MKIKQSIHQSNMGGFYRINRPIAEKLLKGEDVPEKWKIPVKAVSSLFKENKKK
ncbi:MAG: hypothetical protein QXR60_04685 [Candidatus Nanoarchaeia archaeon]